MSNARQAYYTESIQSSATSIISSKKQEILLTTPDRTPTKTLKKELSYNEIVIEGAAV